MERFTHYQARVAELRPPAWSEEVLAQLPPLPEGMLSQFCEWAASLTEQLPSRQDGAAAQEAAGQQMQGGTPPRVPVVCSETRGFYLPAQQGVECHCPSCQQRAAKLGRHILLTPNEFERHAGRHGPQQAMAAHGAAAAAPAASEVTTGTGAGSDRPDEAASAAAALKSPTGRVWMASREDSLEWQQQHHEHGTRLGQRYQAAVTPFLGPPPAVGPEAEVADPHAGLPGPLEEEALEIAATTVADAVRVAITGRAQRARKPPQWMRQTIDPGLALGGRPVVPRDNDEEELERWLAEGGLEAEERQRQQQRQRQSRLQEQIEAALQGGESLVVVKWRLPSGSSSQQLQVTLRLGGACFTGTLAAEEGESELDPAQERRQAEEALVQELEAEGAPPGTRCCLCHGEGEADIPFDKLGLGSRAEPEEGLGRLLLIRTSAVEPYMVACPGHVDAARGIKKRRQSGKRKRPQQQPLCGGPGVAGAGAEGGKEAMADEAQQGERGEANHVAGGAQRQKLGGAGAKQLASGNPVVAGGGPFGPPASIAAQLHK
eukprot:scaffold17.g476.t1